MRAALAEHDDVPRDAIEAQGGRVLPTPPAPVNVTNRLSANSFRTWVGGVARKGVR